jgi:formyltetrahydrofolate-dependent phosphoribosylglycinamide formyltransferase
MKKTRIGVLISGRGSNMQALLVAAAAPDYPAEIALVLSNVASAGGLETARAAGVAAEAIPHKPFGGDRAAHEAALIQRLDAAGVEIVCLAGYMRVLTPLFVRHYAGRMLNIHPSLLPGLEGVDTHARALAAGAKLHGCTVHLVTEDLDAGPILAQAAVPVLPDDTEDTLAARVLVQEHRLYPAALRALIEGRAPCAPAAAALVNPLPAA